MPEHETWFSIALPGLHRSIEALAMILNRYVTGEDGTWMNNEGYGHGGADVHHVVGALFVFLLLVIAGLLLSSGIKDIKAAIIPEGRLTVRTFLELFVETVLGMMEGVMGKKAARRFLPLIGTCALFIFTSNALGLIPGFLPPTESLKTTAACAIVIFVATHYYGLRENGFGHIKHLFGPVTFDPARPVTILAVPLMLLMFVIETIGHLARPLSLSLRLMANMFADHVVLGIFTTVTAAFIGIPLLVPVPIMLLGTLVVVVQTLVFCILSCVYIGMAIEHHDHGDEHGEGHGEGHGHGEKHAAAH